ncbi:hypothetical protein V8F33_010180 [Rhypophila sp. PSN 637]
MHIRATLGCIKCCAFPQFAECTITDHDQHNPKFRSHLYDNIVVRLVVFIVFFRTIHQFISPSPFYYFLHILALDMMTVSGRSSRSTTGGPSSATKPAPSSAGDVFNDASTPFDDHNLDNLGLNSPAPSSIPDISSASPRPGSRDSLVTSQTETRPATQPSTPSPSIRVLTPGTSSAPALIGIEQPTSSNSSFSGLPSGLTIDPSVSTSTHGSPPSRSPFQLTGADYPLPSGQGTSTPPQPSQSATTSIPFDLVGSSRDRQVATPTHGDGNRSSTPTRQSAAVGDGAASVTSQIRQMRIADGSRSPPPEEMPQSTPTSRFLSPNQDDGDTSRRTHSLSPSRPSSEGRRRSSSQLNQPTHNVGDEEPPEDDFNSPAVQRSFMNTRELMAKLETTLGSGNLHLESDSTIRRLREKARELARFQCPPTRTVGFVGDSGVGKSSLLNSLLDRKGLARTSGGGAACTCVATEYHYHEHDNFIIAIDLFTAEELQTQLAEMVRAYRRQHLGPPPIDLEEQKDMADGAKIAIDTFQAMFRGRDEFAQGRFVLSSEPEETIVSTMLLWARELVYDNHGISDNMTVDTVKHCSEALANLTSERGDPQEPNINTGSPERNHRGHPHWPFIKKVRVYVNAHILSKGLILVDLPGLRDLNSARQNITERYILECDEVFAVFWIGRATSDAGVKAIFKLAREARLSNIGIVCTKLDMMDPVESLTDWMGPERRELEGRIDRLKTAEDELMAIEARVANLNELQRKDNLLDEEKLELEGLNFQKYVKERAVETLKLEQDRYLITTRNERVKTRLRSEYRNTITGGNVKVFCVSNYLYWDHRNLSKDKALPWLELSGIIPLRKHCVAMVSDSQLRIATNYMDNDIRSLISSIELWVQSGAGTETAERKALVRETLDVIEGRLKRNLGGRHSPFARIQKNFVEEFREKIYSTQNPARWTNGAVGASNDWRDWNHGSYSAFCRHYGRFTTGVQGKDRDWNREAMEEMVRDIKPLWDVFQRSMGGARTSELLISMHEVMEWAREYLDTQLGEEDVSGEILHESLETREGLLINDLEDAFLPFDSKLSTLGNDLLESYRTSLVGQAMEGTYNRCNAESGTGCTERKYAIIRRTLSDEDFFKNIMRTLYSRFKELTTELENAVKTIVQRHFAAIRETMDILRDENVIAESERDGKFRRLVEEEVTRVRGQLPARVVTRESRC